MATFTIEPPAPVAGVPRSLRGRRELSGDVPTALDQIRMLPGNASIDVTGAWAYFARPDGATIREIVILQPNGGVPEHAEAKMKPRYGANHMEYRQKQADKGFIFLGSTLNEAAMQIVVGILTKNRPDEILYCEDEIANCTHTIEHNDRPDIKDQARKRRASFQARLDLLNAPFDPDALIVELNEIARAQMMATLPAPMMRILKSMLGEVSASLEAKIAAFQRGKALPDGASLKGLKSGGKDEDVLE